MDYIVTDTIVTPPEVAPYFSEHFILMPETYYVTNQAEDVSNRKNTKEDEYLPADAFVFACFSQSYKIEPRVFAAWMDILKSAENAVLWLFSSNEFAAANLKSAAGAAGIDPERLIFAKDIPKPDHLARLPLADLALDTITYGGHTTSVDALGAGVPVITIRGSHFASRASTSILNAIGLQDLVCDDLQSYQSLALKLAMDEAELNNTKARLAKNREIYPLFKSHRFIRHLEAGYEMIWNDHISGVARRHVEVPLLSD